MYSLYDVLTAQHGEEFAPVRCTHQTILRLVRYFEDVVTENKLSALVIQGRCMDGKEPSRELERFTRLTDTARHLYLLAWEEGCDALKWSPAPSSKLTLLQELDDNNREPGPFILVMDQRFCGLLASHAIANDSAAHPTTFEMIWTFEPNVAFTAVQYLMARISAQKPDERAQLETVLNASTAHSPSLRLALSLTTKLTMLMQRQNELEMATNRIGSAISSTLDLEPMLDSAVGEVGRALKAHRAALALWKDGTSKPESINIYERPEKDQSNGLDSASPRDSAQSNGRGQRVSPESDPSTWKIPGPLEVPITYRNGIIGVLAVEDDTPGRDWEDEEVLMVRTVSDQLAIGISHARLFAQVQTQAMTDGLTGLYNHRHFQESLEREINRADRNGHKLSLILLDLDQLKNINDKFGHRSGDAALRHVAEIMLASVRNVDVCARYGGEEFVVILPQCGRADALEVAERLREAIAASPVAKVGQVTASLGVATYPAAAKSKEDLIEMADKAMYQAKSDGRNKVRTLMLDPLTSLNL